MDNYQWILKEQFVSPSELFSSSSSSQLFTSVEFFLTKLALSGIEGVLGSSEVSVVGPHEREEYDRLRWRTTELLLKLINVFLTCHTNETMSYKVSYFSLCPCLCLCPSLCLSLSPFLFLCVVLILILYKCIILFIYSQYVPDTLWSDGLYGVIMDSLFHPTLLGVQPGDLTATNKLTDTVRL